MPDAAEPQRLQKLLAAAGYGSRRACEELIAEGRVEVDRHVVRELGTKADPGAQEIRVDGETLRPPKRVYYLLNKPRGVVSTARDPAGRPRAIDLVPDRPRVFPVGRLDLHSEGLLLLTNDGGLAERLAHPRHEVEKVYDVLVAGSVSREEMSVLRGGLHFAEGFVKPHRLRFKRSEGKSTWIEMVLRQGRNREIRRLLARAGHKVLRLRRVEIGGVKLGDVPPGAFRELTKEETAALRKAAEPKRNQRSRPRRKPSGRRTVAAAQKRARTKNVRKPKAHARSIYKKH